MKSITVMPKTGAIYEGNMMDSNGLGEYLASVTQYTQKPAVVSLSNELKEKGQEFTAALQPKIGYRVNGVNKELSAALRIKEKMNVIQKTMRGGQYDASKSYEMDQLQQQYNAVVNGDNTNQLTIVQFVNEIIGKLEQPSYVTAAFKHIGLDKLRGKIPEEGWPPVRVQVKRLSEPVPTQAEFGQTEFRIFRNDIHIYVSKEDRMEAVIDPLAAATAQGQIQMLRVRELLALKACSTLEKQTYGNIPSFTANGTSQQPHSGNDAPKAFVDIFTQHHNKWFNYLKYFIFSPQDYRDYLSNWFSFAYSEMSVPQGFGVVPMKGLENYGCTAIISPYQPAGFVYALTGEGAYELDGPYVMDSEYDAEKFADYNILHDFVDYHIAHPARFGEKLTITGVPPGTEFTTNAQVEAFVRPPTDVVVSNPDA